MIFDKNISLLLSEEELDKCIDSAAEYFEFLVRKTAHASKRRATQRDIDEVFPIEANRPDTVKLKAGGVAVTKGKEGE